MKKKVLFPIVLIVTILIFSLSAVSLTKDYAELSVITWFLNASKNTFYEKSKFDEIMDDYETVAKYLITDIIANYPDEEYICLGLEGRSTVENVLLYIITDVVENNIYMSLSDEVAKSLINIQDSFADMGYEIDAIRIENGVISFTSIDGVYSLTYEIDKKTDSQKIMNKAQYSNSDKLKGKWKHTIS